MNHHLDNSIYLGKKAVNLIFSIQQPEKKTTIVVEEFVDGIANGRWRKELEHYRSLKTEKERKYFKTNKLPAITLSGTFETTKQDSLQEHSGLLQVDIDLKTTADRELFYESYRGGLCVDPYMVAVFDSPSFGVKGIFHMGVCKDKDEHKQMGLAVLDYLKQTYGIEERLLDKSVLDLGRKFSVSYDPKAYVNWHAKDFSQSDLVTELLENIKTQLFTRSRRQSQTDTELEGFSRTKNQQQIAKRLLERTCQKIRQAAKAQRFETRRRLAFTMGGYHLYFDGNEALQALINAAQGNCTSKEKAKRDVLSAYSAGQQQPLIIEERTREENSVEVVLEQQNQIAEFYPYDASIPRTQIPRGQYLSQLLQPEHYAPKSVTNLIASTGSGKMIALKEIQKCLGERIIYVSPLVRLVEQAKKDLKAVGYMDGLKDIPTAKIFATTINSLCTPKRNITQLLKLVRQQQLPYMGKGICLVLDEVHQVAEKLFEPSCETNYPEFVEFCRTYVSRIITLTATETSFSRAFTEQLAKDLGFAEKSYFFQKSAKKIALEHLSLSRNQALPQVLELLKARQPTRAAILCQSKEKTEKLATLLERELGVDPKEICLVNADRDTPLNQAAKYIVGSPSLATGISFTTQIDLFVLVTEDSIFQPQDLEQYTARVREPENTEFLLITEKRRNLSYGRYSTNLQRELGYLNWVQENINQEIQRGFDDPKLKQQIRLLEYDSESQFWFFHPLYQLLNAERSAFGNFSKSVGVAAFVEYLKQHPPRDYSFVIEDFDGELAISEESKQVCSALAQERREEKILKMEEVEILKNIAAYNLARADFKSLQMRDAPKDEEEREEYQKLRELLPLQMKKTEAHLLGLDTTGLDLQRTKECVTKAYRYATLLSLLTMTQLPQADKLFKAMMTRWAKADYVQKLYITPKWKFVKEVLEILKSKDGVEEQRQQFELLLDRMKNQKFETLFGLKKSEQNKREVLNKFGLVFEDLKQAWQTLGVDHRVYRDVINDLIGAAGIGEQSELVHELLEQQDKMQQCSSSEELRHWYNGFMKMLKGNWAALEEYQHGDWTIVDRKQMEKEAREQQELVEVKEQLLKLRRSGRRSEESDKTAGRLMLLFA